MKKMTTQKNKGVMITLLGISLAFLGYNFVYASAPATDSTTSIIPKIAGAAVNPQDQYLKVDSSNASLGPSNNGTANTTVKCPAGTQMVGVVESYTGYNMGGPIVQNSSVPSSWTANAPNGTTTEYYGNFEYIPQCSSMNWWTLECEHTQWVQEYNQIDTLQPVCATNYYNWENINGNPNPVTASTQLGP
jgi:hypothetical protein